jgi:hypothetical protein
VITSKRGDVYAMSTVPEDVTKLAMEPGEYVLTLVGVRHTSGRDLGDEDPDQPMRKLFVYMHARKPGT